LPWVQAHCRSSGRSRPFLPRRECCAVACQVLCPGPVVTLPPVVGVGVLLERLRSSTFGAFAVTPHPPSASAPEFQLHGAITRMRLLRMCQYRIGLLVRATAL
jgi:hypothetical protein